MKKIAVFASGNGSNAENIINYMRATGAEAEVAVIVTNRKDAGVIGRANRLNVPVEVMSRQEINDSSRMLYVIDNYGIDAIVLAGFLLMVPGFLIERFPDKILNIHPSLLPKFGGKLLFIGEILDKCTFMHGVETFLKPPYIRSFDTVKYTVNGEEKLFTQNNTFGWVAEFQRIEWLLEYPDIRKGKLGEATVFLIDTRALLAAALLKMSAEPYAFVTDISMYI